MKTADDAGGRTLDPRNYTGRSTKTTMTDHSRDTDGEFEYHLRQAYHLAERDEVRYHIRKAAATLRE
ncbi:hypothetical protein [Halogranum amylolyticum]|uniref:hypothetical protein n=1 Tax=Halogranum amylolyticum TaxID=660520 RepID=UPI001114AA47|nr:hypothetical protein [Halogranum amylolyticum]